MTSQLTHLQAVASSICIAVIGLSFFNPSNPPAGRTGAPFDAQCSTGGGCHFTDNPAFSGTISWSGLPASILPNTAYTVTFTCSVTAGSPSIAGFEAVAVSTSASTQAGAWTNGAGTNTTTLGGRSYIRQSTPQSFSGGQVSWTFTWTSPASVTGNNVTFYSTCNMANGNGGNSGDHIEINSFDVPFPGSTPISSATVTTTPANCNGSADGTATGNAVGGTPPYTFNWSNGGSGQTITSLPAGNYIVTVTDLAGQTKTASGTITQPTAMAMTLSTPGQITCNNPQTTVMAMCSGGSPAYSFQWSDGTTGNILTATSGGVYTVTATDTHGCTKTNFASVTANNTPPVSSAGPDQSINCGQPTVQMQGAGSSGGGISYLWTASGGGNILSGATTLTPTVNAAGTYTLKVTNAANGCTATSSASVTSNISPPTVQVTGGALSCANGSVTLNVTTNAASPSFSWAGPGGFTSSSQNPTVSLAGTYTVTVTNTANNCSATGSTTVTGSVAPTASATGGTITCTNPSASLSATTNAANPTFSWAGPGGFTSTLQNPTTTAAGTYTVTVTNPANGCTAMATAIVAANNAPPGASATGGTLTCTTTSVTLSGSSPTSGVTFAWAGPGGPLPNPTVTAPGNYTLTVNNPANGCSSTATATVTQNIAQPNISAAGGNLTCTVTCLNLTGNSTTTNATYAWSGPGGFASNLASPQVCAPGTYTLTVTAPNGCTASQTVTVTQNIAQPNASAAGATISCLTPNPTISGNSTTSGATFAWTGPNGFTSNVQNPSVSVSGDYNLVVTNPGNGCTATASASVSGNTTPPGATASVSGEITCAQASAILGGNSTASNPTYAWEGPGNFSSTLQNPTVTAGGTYTLTVTGTNSCTSTATVTVNANTTLPTAAIAAPGNLNCNQAVVQLDGTGSSQGGNFTYAWTTMNGNITSGANTLTPTVNAAGVYNLLVTNTLNGCTKTAAATVNQTPPLTAAISGSQNVGCFGQTSGSATVAATGGGGNLTYLWSNGATGTSISNLAAGSYSVVVTDSENCTAGASVTISQPDAVAANATSTGETANGANDGTANAGPTGGTSPFGFAWSNGSTNQMITNLAPGSYTVTVTDANDCTAVQTVTVNQFGCTIALEVTGENIDCNGSQNGTASASLTGGNGPFSYVWSNGGMDESISDLAPGTYSVSILDASGCPVTGSVNITEPPAVNANATATAETANGSNDGTATANATGGISPYTFVWNTGATTATISGLVPGTYTVTVHDANGCSDVQSATVAQFGCAISTTISAVQNPCHGDALGIATASIAGGSAPFQYAWSNGGATASIDGLAAGTYTVSVTDNSGCNSTQEVQLVDPQSLALTILDLQDVLCPESMDGSVSVQAHGGTQPYFYVWSNGETTQDITNLGVGSYDLLLLDDHGCAADFSVSIASTDAEAPKVSCPNDIQVCDGIAVVWDPAPATDNCNLPADAVKQTCGPVSGTILPVGVATVCYQATDASGNTATCEFQIQILALPTLLSSQVAHESNGGGDGGVKVETATPGAAFSWTGPNGFTANTQNISNLHAGIYHLSVTSAEGCESTFTFEVKNLVGTVEPSDWAAMQVLPNPTNEFFELKNPASVPLLGGQVMDLRGRLLLVLSSDDLSGLVDVSRLPGGVFHLILVAEGGERRVLRFVKI